MHDINFYGTVTVGAKGQIVIPVEAREKMNIQPGDKLFVIGTGPEGKMLGICTEDSVRGIMTALSDKLDKMRQAVTPDDSNK
ncbi:MAG TPA: AbrB/MazE/SpoVT family DNA-binding domain-containing protein [Verrucomicrobiae bacterium]|nr:AbrB/MazE/SpoVT family DNA-binding domain-containing protein [Verrucomicrobiae bacterium]